MEPSTIDSGFILSLPKLQNPASDVAYQRLLAWYLPQPLLNNLRPRLEKFGDEAISDHINEWISTAERDQPYVKSRNVWGEKYPHDRLVTSEGWKQLGRWGILNGLDMSIFNKPLNWWTDCHSQSCCTRLRGGVWPFSSDSTTCVVSSLPCFAGRLGLNI